MTTVAVALIERAGKLLICRRRSDQSHAGKWEFPGGKVERGEASRDALARELKEELGVEVIRAEECVRYEYAYPGKARLRLVFFRVETYRGRVAGEQFAEIRWESRGALARFDFLEGDGRIVRELADGRH